LGIDNEEQDVALYRRLLINGFKAKIVFRADYMIGLAFSFLYIALQIFIWRGLYGDSGEAKMGIVLNDMVAYTILSGVTRMLTKSDVSLDINASVLDGSISTRLLLPLGYRTYYFLSNLSENLFWSLYQSLPPILVAIVFFGLRFDLAPQRFGIYCISVMMALAINFLFSFIMGASVIWLRDAYFLERYIELIFRLFAGNIVPMWFFPGWLNTASRFLPFRYVIFEPISILLGKTPMERVAGVLGMQVLWIAILFGLMSLIWSLGKKHIMIQGG
jgi:ABC-2 type transport system permease protein